MIHSAIYIYRKLCYNSTNTKTGVSTYDYY